MYISQYGGDRILTDAQKVEEFNTSKAS